MRFLLDTCVVSEFIKPKPVERVLDWLGRQPEERLYLSILTLGELSKGIALLPSGQRQARLKTWMEEELKPRFYGRWIPLDEEIAERWGEITAQSARGGNTLPVIDGLLAATALVHGMTFITRNEADMRSSGAKILNPWIDAG